MKQPSELLHEHSVHKENIVTPTNVNAKDIEARLVRVNGLVQGVGFRPTVWRIAAALNLRGEVFNDPQGVGVRLEGDPQALDAFPAALRRECPPLARIDTLEVFPAETVGFTDFRIVKSETAGEVSTMITPDAGHASQRSLRRPIAALATPSPTARTAVRALRLRAPFPTIVRRRPWRCFRCVRPV